MHAVIEALILGLVQGLTEFIPISSSGHLLLIGELLNLSQNGFAFELALNAGTLLALVVYFWSDLMQLARGVVQKRDLRLVGLLFVATLPAVLAGSVLIDYAETVFRSPYITVTALIGVGLLMIFIDRMSGKRTIASIKITDALLIGLAQATALVPGVSRSGVTIVAGRSLGLSGAEAARFSFLMAIPIVAGALLRLAFEPEFAQLADNNITVVVGIIASFVSGLWAIGFLLRFLQSHGLKWFGLYRIIFGGMVLLLLLYKGSA